MYIYTYGNVGRGNMSLFGYLSISLDVTYLVRNCIRLVQLFPDLAYDYFDVLLWYSYLEKIPRRLVDVTKTIDENHFIWNDRTKAFRLQFQYLGYLSCESRLFLGFE